MPIDQPPETDSENDLSECLQAYYRGTLSHTPSASFSRRFTDNTIALTEGGRIEHNIDIHCDHTYKSKQARVPNELLSVSHFYHSKQPVFVKRIQQYTIDNIIKRRRRRSTMSSPLLFLFDGMLSQDDEQVQEALTAIARDCQIPPQMPVYPLLAHYLHRYPHVAAIPSTHDGSVPLHFAASLGNVAVAELIWSHVSCLQKAGTFSLLYVYTKTASHFDSLSANYIIIRAVPSSCHYSQSKRENTPSLCSTYVYSTIALAQIF